MNKIYKVIWSKVKHQYVVTSEFAHSCTKSTTSRVGKTALAALAAFVLTAGVGGVQAAGTAEQADLESAGIVAGHINPNYDGSTPEGAIAIGEGSEVLGNYTTAVGANSTITGGYGTAVGNNSNVTGSWGTAVGKSSAAAGWATAIGGASNAAEQATAIGYHAMAQGEGSIAIGEKSQVIEKAVGGIAIGEDSIVKGLHSVAIGQSSMASGTNTTALGVGSKAFGSASTAIGANAQVAAGSTGRYSVALGADSVADGQYMVSVGNDTLKRQIVNVAAGTKAAHAVTVGQLQAASDEATKTIHGVTLDNGTIKAANGNFEVGEDGTTYIRAGQSQVQVRDDLTALNYGTNSVIVNRDGVALTGDVTADNSVKVGLVGYDADNEFAPIYGTEMGADGSFSTAQGSFRVDKNGNVWAANGDVTIDADGTTYVHAGRSELQVTEDQSVLRHADNGIIVNEDGVAVAGDFEAGNGAVKINKDGEFWAGNDNFRVTGDGDVYSLNGKSQFQVTDKLVAMQYGTNNYVMVNEDGVAISGDLKLDGALDTGDLDADSLYVADGKFRVESDGTMYSQVGNSQLQVRDDLVAMNYGPNTAVMLSEDGVTLKGDVVVEDNLMIGNGMTYFANDGSFTAAGGKFSVGGYGEFTAAGGRFAVTADGQAYIGGTTDPNNAVVTKGDLTNAVEGVENSSVQWDDPQTKDSINDVGLKDGNVTANNVTTGSLDVTGSANVGGDLNVGGKLTINGSQVATTDQVNGVITDVANVKTNVSNIRDQIGLDEGQNVSEALNNHGETLVDGINKNTSAIGDVSTLKGTNADGSTYTNLTDAVNGNYDRIEQNTAAIAQNSQAINSLGHQVSDLGDEIDSVGAISAALAGLHPITSTATS